MRNRIPQMTEAVDDVVTHCDALRAAVERLEHPDDFKDEILPALKRLVKATAVVKATVEAVATNALPHSWRLGGQVQGAIDELRETMAEHNISLSTRRD